MHSRILLFIFYTTLGALTHAKPVYVQLSDAIKLKMSDGEEYVVRAASHLMTSRTKVHLIVNDETVASKTRPQNSEFRLAYDDKGTKLRAICALESVKPTGDVNMAYVDKVSMKRNLSTVERGYMLPMICKIRVDGVEVGQLQLDRLMKLEKP